MTDERNQGGEKPPFEVISGGLDKPPTAPIGGSAVVSPRIPPGANLSTQERRVWEYICDNLAAAGLEHVTAGLTIKVITRTYMDWLEALRDCDNTGRYATSDNGNRYELPHSYTEKQLKKDLLRWLPQACMTIPSLASARAKLGDGGQQGDLFDELVHHATASRPGS